MSANVRNNSLQVRHVVGVMTGTSIDGIDAALVRIQGRGLDMRAELIRHISQPFDDIRLGLRAAAEQTPMSAGDFAKLAWDFGNLHVSAIREVLPPSTSIDLICAHGQTVFHQPPISWQLLNPAPIAAAFKCPVVFDLRQADLAAGGQGAPITPIADWILFRDEKKTRAIVNLGGFCNVTILPKRAGVSSLPLETSALDGIRGFDVCACNHILDEIARQVLQMPFDGDGRVAASGRANFAAAGNLYGMVLHQARQGRSLGTGDETREWLDHYRESMAPADLAATAVLGIADHIAHTLHEHSIDEVILSGGGARNHALAHSIGQQFGKPILLSSDLGAPLEAREAMGFAILGALCEDRVPITLRQVTGCTAPAPISGTWCLP